MSYKPTIFLLNGLMGISGLLSVGGGLWTVAEHPECDYGVAGIWMGLAALFIVLFGVCGFRKEEQLCLCILYIALSITFAILQILTVMDIRKVDNENKGFLDPILILLIFSSTTSPATFILSIFQVTFVWVKTCVNHFSEEKISYDRF
eukprot:TRINITY_DN31727_c0_g1_i1.p1 TRINITY_DN31727_c0_g1~~TRINITY_DN31727_c0_g1_i1.p1  ORF type:complete len:148 (-),score=31.38 TRINITY_DN31727_c0_g1_i1:208-651(-)